ncbi:hypothetical protein Tdes44962_MAKER09012 [Teratosphaeria destructans]|uniref:Uncharacterized protein n=1 Tax=Teratosphaeria destructans TaxID=418781 RepID=A0A9W7SUR8_9PEZI|nr:hypothetical protein Tdes44962_MAKER09012 [Teratosphaeria destructans]
MSRTMWQSSGARSGVKATAVNAKHEPSTTGGPHMIRVHKDGHLGRPCDLFGALDPSATCRAHSAVLSRKGSDGGDIHPKAPRGFEG